MDFALPMTANEWLDISRLYTSITKAERQAQKRRRKSMATQMRCLPRIDPLQRRRSFVNGNAELCAAPVAFSMHADPHRRFLDPPPASIADQGDDALNAWNTFKNYVSN